MNKNEWKFVFIKYRGVLNRLYDCLFVSQEKLCDLLLRNVTREVETIQKTLRRISTQ